MKQRDARRQEAQTYRGQAPVKWCAVCGREISWRRDWGNVKYCSDNCRASGLTSLDIEIEKTILKLLQDRPAGATICPSEAARTLQPCETDDSWKVLYGTDPARRQEVGSPPAGRMASGRPAG